MYSLLCLILLYATCYVCSVRNSDMAGDVSSPTSDAPDMHITGLGDRSLRRPSYKTFVSCRVSTLKILARCLVVPLSLLSMARSRSYLASSISTRTIILTDRGPYFRRVPLQDTSPSKSLQMQLIELLMRFVLTSKVQRARLSHWSSIATASCILLYWPDLSGPDLS